MAESPTKVALRRGADAVAVCRCVGTPITQPGGCFTCGRPRYAPKPPKELAVQRYEPPEREGLPKVSPLRESHRLPLHQRDVGDYLGTFY